MKVINKTIILFSLFFISISCEEALEEEAFSELTPDSFLTTEEGINSLLNSAYTYGQLFTFQAYNAYLNMSGMTSGAIWNQGGGIEFWHSQLTNFTWDSNHSFVNFFWRENYLAIRDANIVIDNIELGDFSTDFKQRVSAEARFLRAWSYRNLYIHFGGVPLYTSSASEEIQLLSPKATAEEVAQFVISELEEIIPLLPQENTFGRANRSAAQGLLTKFYLNNRRWQEAADLAQVIINSGLHSLESDYNEVFSLENEGNPEILWALVSVAPGNGRSINSLIVAPDYPLKPNEATFAARTYMFDEFVDLFEPNDTRDDRFIRSYTNINGEFIQLYGNDQTHPLKYDFDPAQIGVNQGNDIPVVRYADILLSRAEALNEIGGPSQETINLINQVRLRANASPIDLAGFTQESLRDFILQERRLEFWFEGKEREDLLRQNKFISDAQSRGKNAQDFHRLFAIPQSDIDANPNLEQNPGY